MAAILRNNVKIDEPARKVVKRSTHRVVGYHASVKMGRAIPWESQIEKAYFEQLEVDPRVHEFYAQPTTFNWGNLRYTPDAYVIEHGGAYFVEVKPDAVLFKHLEMERICKLVHLMEDMGFALKLMLKSDIFEPVKRRNVVTLLREVRKALSPQDIDLILERLHLNHLTLGEIMELEGDAMRKLVFPAITQGLLSIDICRDLLSQIPEIIEDC